MALTPSSYGANTVSGLGQMVSGVGSIISAQNAKATGNYNAAVSLQQAEAQKQSYQLNLDEYKTQAQDELAQQQASYAKSGVRFSGTPVEAMTQSLIDVNFNEAVMSYNNDIQVQKLQNQAALERYTADQTEQSDYTKGALSFVEGGLTLERQIGAGHVGNDGTGTYTLPSAETVLG